MFGLQDRQIATLVIGLLAALKIILQAFGINIINDTEINQIADGVAALATVLAVFMKHEKKNSGSGGNASESGDTSSPNTNKG